MFSMIFSRQLREASGGFTYRAALVLLTLLIPLSAYIQARHYNRALADYQERQRIHEAERTQDRIVLTRPVPPLLPFFNGDYDRLADEFTLYADPVRLASSSEDLAPLDQLFPRYDLSLLIGVLLTLVAILLAHDTITREKERGTLRLMLSSPVPRRTILSAKVAAIIFLLSAALLYTVLFYLLLLRLCAGGTVALTGRMLGELTLFTLIALLTLIVFAGLGLALSAIVRSTSAALAVCVAVWVTVVVIWPSLSPYLASSLSPARPSQEVRLEVFFKESDLIRGELADHRQAAAEMQAQGTDLATAWKRHVAIREAWLVRKQDEVGSISRQQEEQVRRQQRAARRLLIASPYGAFRETLGELCGTGLSGYHAFHDAIANYFDHEFLPARFVALAKEVPTSAHATDDETPPPPALLTPSLAAQLRASLLPVGSLLVEVILTFGFCFWRFEHYDPR